jgi:hypothetical protein
MYKPSKISQLNNQVNPKFKNLFKQIFWLGISWLIIPFFLIEIFMIIGEPYLFKGLYQYDPDLGFKIRPYVNGNNQFGFNDRDYSLEKSAGKYRILIISDSFNWAGGQQGNYTNLLEEKFAKYYGDDRVEIINAGYPGTHTGEQLALLKKYAIQYNPDLVILGFFAGNDVKDADPKRKRIIVNDLYVDIKRDEELIILGYPIIKQSRLWLFVQQKWKIWQSYQQAQKDLKKSSLPANYLLASRHLLLTSNIPNSPSTQPANREQSPGILSESDFFKEERDRLKFCDRQKLAEGKRDKRFNYITASIGEIRELLQNKNIKFIVALYPDEYQVNSELFQAILRRYNLPVDQWEVTCQQNRVIQYLQSQQIAYIDLLPRFQNEQQKQPLYLFQEPHWNSAGNQLASDILFNYLQPKVNQYFQKSN